MRRKRRIPALLLCSFLLLPLLPARAAASGSAGVFAASDASGAPGDTVQVTVSAENNPGIIAAALRVGYDADRLELVKVEDGGLLSSPVFSDSLSRNPYYLSWNDALAAGSITKNGVLAALSFRIKDGCAAGTTSVSVSHTAGDVFDSDLKTVLFSDRNGSVTVTGGSAGTSSGTAAGTPSSGASAAGSAAYRSFEDLSADGWYREDVEFMLKWGYMNGVSASRFQPDGPMTRAQFLTVLYRTKNSPASSGCRDPFTDVDESAWYGPAVLWGAQNGIVSGVSAGRFEPDGSVTREQIAAILYRYSGAKADSADRLSAFRDAGSVSAYAKEAMNWAVGAGLICGSNSLLLPQAAATRVQTAAILTRFLKMSTAVPVPTEPNPAE